MFILVSVILVALFSAADASWSIGYVYNTSSSLEKHESYYDQMSEEHHFVFIEKRGLLVKAMYSVLLPSGDTRTTPLPINAPQQLVITGLDNGKNLMIAFSGTRENSEEIADIYIIESKDDGLTWSPQQRIPRKDMDDNLPRTKPSLLFTNTKRLFVFYQCERKVCFSTRPSGSEIFQDEKIVSTLEPSTRLVPAFVETQPSIVILSWLSVKEDNPSHCRLTFAYTRNNGLEWAEHKDSYVNAHFYPYNGFDSFAYESSGVYAVRSFLALTNYGNSFFDDFIFRREQIESYSIDGSSIDPFDTLSFRITKCEANGKRSFFYYKTAEQSGRARFLIISEAHRASDMDVPFVTVSAGLIDSPFLGCSIDNQLFASSIISVSTPNGIIHSLAIATYDQTSLTSQ